MSSWPAVEEGIAARASDIDLVCLNGYFFPLQRGGFEGKRRGAKLVVVTMCIGGGQVPPACSKSADHPEVPS
jgi:hypothetical protein